MNGNWYINYRVDEIRRREAIALAQQEQLAKMAAQPVEVRKNLPMFKRWQHRLGVVMVNWGCRLQAQSIPVRIITAPDGKYLRMKGKR